jgi:hypothetical protein
MTNQDRRKHGRYPSLNLLFYKCLNQKGIRIDQGMGRTLNVSKTGLLLETYHPIEANYILILGIGLKEETVDIKGEVIHSTRSKNDRYESGIEFIGMDDRAKSILYKYIEAFKNFEQNQHTALDDFEKKGTT